MSEYKHLGSIIAADGGLVPDANHRASLALNAFGPIAMKVFGSKSVCVSLKLNFFDSLVLSRLLYNTQLWVVTSPSSHSAVRRLNKVYMQVARRIADCARYGQERCITDLDVRKRLDIVSIECKMRQMRLLYLGRLVRFGPEPLLALLALRGDDEDHRMMPWTSQIIEDLYILHKYHRWSLSELPCPRVRASAWYALMKDFPESWKELVSKYLYSDFLSLRSREKTENVL